MAGLKKEDEEILKELLEIKITDSKSVILKKKLFKEVWEKISNIKIRNGVLNNFSEIALLQEVNLLSLAIFRETSGWFLKQQRIKNYMLYIENSAVFASEAEKIELRVKWKACKRWLRTCEETGRHDIPPPIDLLKD